MARIIGGAGRGRRLVAPKGRATRPSSARVRQTLFDILAKLLPGCRFLDLFAGGGGVGLEALSRGASAVVLVERDAAAVAALRRNAAALAGAGGEARVYRQEALTAVAGLAARAERFDVVFLDPPYSAEYEPLLAAAETLVAEAGVAVAEHFHKKRLPETIGRLRQTRSVKVGDHRLTFYARTPSEAGAGGAARGVE
jgi:16S rRNA (guanine(966)-N(2))-methyltransferase RsmD